MTALFELLVERAISSSKTMVGVAKEILIIAEDVKAIKESLVTFAKAIQLQQMAIDTLMDQNEVTKQFDLAITKSVEKKEKPN